MNRNVESHFALNPTRLDMSRSRFDMSFGNKTSFNVGDVVPLCRPIEILPGDTMSVDTSKVVRLQTLLHPVADNLYLDTYWFFVPNRLVDISWKQFMGENTTSAWLPTATYTMPQISTGNTGFPIGSVADYMGLPVNIPNMCPVSALPFRGYALICDEWFRSENVSDPLYIPLGTSAVVYDPNALPVSQPAQGGTLFKAAKFFDYFTACLPAPQKGPDVKIPLETTTTNNGWIPVVAHNAVHGNAGRGVGLIGKNGTIGASSTGNQLVGMNTSSWALTAYASTPTAIFDPANLWANAQALQCTVNALRTAFQIQKLYERDARGGTRYIEILKSHFGVTSPDSRLQRPEYLGGNRIPISVSEVTNNSKDSSNYLGDLGGMSRTTDVHSDFTHSFTEHGYLFCLGVARYDHSYQQGIHRSWLRQDRLDFYWPVLANIGEQAVLTREIYAASNDHTANTPTMEGTVFGYQERWAEYRYQPNMITGMMRSASNSGLDSWHFGDDYSQAPTLSDGWIREDKTNVDRTLAVTSSTADQIFGDFYFKIIATRCMPLYSVPGLIDHH